MPYARSKTTQFDAKILYLVSFRFKKLNDFYGNIGGPMIRRRDGTQFGITRAIIRDRDADEPTTVQVYTKISYFFDWITAVTSLDLPKC